jgi:hypothetical protein
MSNPPFVAPAKPAPATERWENEGGLLLAMKPAPARPAVRSGKREEDTAVGCRAKAAADLVRAEALGADRMRWRMEHSAAAWTARAEVLEMIERKADARRCAAGRAAAG